jgi:hypothetical protein
VVAAFPAPNAPAGLGACATINDPKPGCQSPEQASASYSESLAKYGRVGRMARCRLRMASELVSLDLTPDGVRFPADATTTLLAQAYQGEIGFQT